MARPARPGRGKTGWLAKALLVLVPPALIYLGFAFAPPYLRYMKARSILNNAGSESYSLRSDRHRWYEVIEDIRRDLREKLIKALRVADNDLELEIKKTDHKIRIMAEWVDEAGYPLTGKSARLKFSYDVEARTR